jgi:Fic family protein
MHRGLTGHYLPSTTAGETFRAFIPNPLPPKPPLDISEALRADLDRATLALGRLDGSTTVLPDPKLFLFMYVRKEAVLSSQIEGTQSSLSDLLLFENEGTSGIPLNDVQEVSNYVAAMDLGLKRLSEGFPLSLRLLKEIHGTLLAKGRGASKEPGEFRRSQNWIGGSRPGNAHFVPPPPDGLLDCLGALERFIRNDPDPTPALIKAGLAHVQFETIHPFLDGNGRLGRLLITFLLCSEKILSEPMLYLSLYLKENRAEYYDLLQRVRTEGIWEEWLVFFVRGVAEAAEQAAVTARQILHLFADDRNRIKSLGTTAGRALQVHDQLQRRPVTSIGQLAEGSGLSVPTVTSALKDLQQIGLVQETTGGRYGRHFAYDHYLKILSKGTEPLPR